MNIRIIDDNFDQKAYDEKAIHPLQSWAWGEARKKMGLEVLRIGRFENNRLTDVFQLSFHKIPNTSFKIGYLPRSKSPPTDVLNFLNDYGKNHQVVFIKIEPYSQETFNAKRLTLNIKESPHPLFPQWTQILDLTKSEDELLKEMKPKTRYNIRLAQKKGVFVKEESNEKGFNVFVKLYFDTCQRQKYYGHNTNYHRFIWETLKANIAHILIAYFEDEPVAAYELFYFNNVCYYPYGGSSTAHRNTMAANLLMWEAIKLGKKLGAGKFDMWGSLPPKYNPNDPWSGFTRFKEGYGGKFTQFVESHDLVINPLLYQGYNLAFKLRELFLKAKKMI